MLREPRHVVIGRRSAFVDERGGLPDLYIMRADGTQVRQVARTARWDSAPD
jgi:hypothetical protein